MSEQGSERGPDGTGDWSPEDYSDGKKPGEWQTSYPPEALKEIYWESAYLAVIFFSYLIGLFVVIHLSCDVKTEAPVQDGSPIISCKTSLLLVFLASYISGTLGGCSFGIKWMYHIVAKRWWHQDRRLWRLLSPHLSGVVALFMVFLVGGGLLQMFDKDFINRPIGVMAFSFLVGYFSDKALAKMAEIADTLFGGRIVKKKKKEKPDNAPPRS